MATVATNLTTTGGSATSGIKNQLQYYFSKKLLERIMETTVLEQFANKAPLPRQAGAKQISFFRFGGADSTIKDVSGTTFTAGSQAVMDLTEGDPANTADTANHRTIGLTRVNVDLKQYGEVISISDLMSNVELFNHMEQGVAVAGDDAALFADTIIRNALAKTGNGITRRYAQGGAGTATSYATVASGNETLIASDLLDAMTNLRVDKAVPINGQFCAAVAPQIARDLMQDSDWLAAAKNVDTQNLYRGEIGSLFGCKIIQHTNPFRSSSQYTYSSSGNVFSNFVFGANAYGAPSLDSESPFAPKMTIVDTPDKSDPLNQKLLIGWKCFYASEVLKPESIVEIYSETAYA